MSDNKKYYYLKLKDNFFDSDELIVLESMPDGYIYSNILLKLYLRSLKYEGRLMFNDRIPFNSQMLANVTRHSVGDVEKAVHLFNDLGLIEVMDNGAIYMMDIQNFIGESSTEADRIRAYRAKIAQEKKEVQMLQDSSYKCNNKCTPEIELEKKIELEIELEKPSNEVEQKVSSKESELKERFEAIWKLYPNKKGKRRAYPSYKAAIKEGTTDEQIITGIEAYIEECRKNKTSKDYMMHGSTFFYQRRWEDDYNIPTNEAPKKVDYQKAFEEYFAEQKKPTSASHSSWNV